jgi:hypothetical protein
VVNVYKFQVPNVIPRVCVQFISFVQKYTEFQALIGL